LWASVSTIANTMQMEGEVLRHAAKTSVSVAHFGFKRQKSESDQNLVKLD
jgi:hypothetical protein